MCGLSELPSVARKPVRKTPRYKHAILSGTRVNLAGSRAADVAKSETRVCHGDAFPAQGGTEGQPRTQKARLGSGSCDAQVIGSLIH
jgi:hypothetical protein